MVRLVIFVLTGSLVLSPIRGHAQWALNGTPVSTVANSEGLASIIPDGFGGAFILWEDYRTGTYPDIYLQRVNALGAPQWAANGVPVCIAPFNQKFPTMISDGSGGVIVAWNDDRAAANNNDIYAQRVNGAGVVQWAATGVAVCTAANHQQYPAIASDGAGGAIVSWNDDRSGVNTYHVFAQRVNASGIPQWTGNGVAIQTATLGGEQVMISDGAGGAIVAFAGGTGDISAQRLNASGVVQWAANGVALCVAPNGQGLIQIVTDGASGAIVAWSDLRSGTDDIYARRINASGVPQWTANGVALCTAANDQFLTTVTSDGAGGAMVAWEDHRSDIDTEIDIYAQKVNVSGTVQWSANGVAVCTAQEDQFWPRMVSDSAGGAIVTWMDGRVIPGDIYAQRVSQAGAALWTANGVAVCLTGEPVSPVIASNGVGGAIIAWKDSRNPTAYDIYAQRIEAKYGNWGRPDAWIKSVDDIPSDQGGHVMSRWYASDRDVYPQQEISHYTLWRELTASSAAPMDHAGFIDPSTIGPEFTGKAYRQSSTAAASTTWEFIATIPTRYATEYGFNTPTLADSMAGNAADATYQVLAHTTNAFVFYEGNLFTGHSVDNLSPPAPLFLTAQRVGADVHLEWNRVHVPDLKNYAVYRATSSGVTPLPVNFLASSNDSILVDAGAPAIPLYYVVTANDVHANQSSPSNEAVASPATGVTTPAIRELTMNQNRPNPFGTATELEIGLPASSDVLLEVYDVAGRRVRSQLLPQQQAGWQRVRFDGRSDAGRALASGVYFCRVTARGSTVTRKMVIAR